jgi:nucleotidyltransferase substrate binding protein (TIGR01987 family)
MNEEVRWQQRFQNYLKALGQLNSALAKYDETAEALIKEGILQRFEFTHELAWKVMKDYLEYEGHQGITGSRSASRLAFSLGLVSDGQVWMDMIESRNRTVHTYDEKVLEQEFSTVTDAIREKHAGSFIMYGLPETILLKMQGVFARHPEIEKVIIYGSRAKGNYRPGSDIDITLYGQALSEALLSKVLVELDDLNTPYLMDVSLFSHLQSEELKKHIQENGRIFYEQV